MNQSEVQLLLDRPRGTRMVLSCYADTRVTDGFESHWKQHMKSEARRIRKLLAVDVLSRQEFEQNLESAWKAIDGSTAPGTAVFCFGANDEVVCLPSEVPYPNRLVVAEEPYLVPLLVAASQRRTYLAIVTDTHRGRLYAASSGVLHLLAELDEDVPRKQHSAGERWGKHQATIARHREDRILHYLKDLVRKVEEAWNAQSFQGIVLLGQHQLLAEVRSLLPKALCDRLVHEAPFDWPEGPSGVQAEVEKVIVARADAEEKELRAEVERRLKEGYANAVGPQEVIDALKDGLAGAVLLDNSLGELGSRCAGCLSVFSAVTETCPYCSSSCARVNLWQEILVFALRHQVPVHILASDPADSASWKVAAFLNRDLSPGAQPSTLKLGASPGAD
jgi:peptide subunit release factor 1 (eRF1)